MESCAYEMFHSPTRAHGDNRMGFYIFMTVANIHNSCDGKLRVWNAPQGPSAITEWGSHTQPIKAILTLEPSAGWPVSGVCGCV